MTPDKEQMEAIRQASERRKAREKATVKVAPVKDIGPLPTNTTAFVKDLGPVHHPFRVVEEEDVKPGVAALRVKNRNRNVPLVCLVHEAARQVIGHAQDGTVSWGGVVLSPEASLKVRNHSPTGFSWGYNGSGPAQLALALLLQAGVAEERAVQLYQKFKEERIAPLDRLQDFVMEMDDISWWVEKNGGTDVE